MAGNVTLTIDGVDATKAAFSSAEARATTLNRRFGELSRKQQSALKREAREVAASERAYRNYQREQAKSVESSRRSAGLRVAIVSAAALKIGGFLKGTLDLYGEQERAVEGLEAALRAQGSYTPELSRKYQDMASALQKVSTTGDEALLAHQSLLVQIGDVGPADMERALTAAQDLSVGIGRDLKTAVELVGKAAAGETSTLTRYGIVLSDAEKEGDLFEAVLGKIEQRFGGQMAAHTETYAGSTEQLGNNWGDLKETIGGFLSGPALGLTAWLNNTVTSTNDWLKETEEVTGERGLLGLVGQLTGATGAIEYFSEKWGDATAAQDLYTYRTDEFVGPVIRELKTDVEAVTEAVKEQDLAILESKRIVGENYLFTLRDWETQNVDIAASLNDLTVTAFPNLDNMMTGTVIPTVKSKTFAFKEATSAIRAQGSEIVDRFIPNSLGPLKGGLDSIVGGIMGGGEEGEGGGIIGSFQSWMNAVGPAGFIGIGITLLVQHFDKIIGAISTFVGWIGRAIKGLGRMLGLAGSAGETYDEWVARGSPRGGGGDSSGGSRTPTPGGGIPDGPPSGTPGYGGLRHAGGPVMAGMTYQTIPGETFTPAASGTVSPAGSAGAADRSSW